MGLGFINALRVLKLLWPFLKEMLFDDRRTKVRSPMLLIFTTITMIGFVLVMTFWSDQLQNIMNRWIFNEPHETVEEEQDRKEQEYAGSMERRLGETLQQLDRLENENQSLQEDLEKTNEKLNRYENIIEYLRNENKRLRKRLREQDNVIQRNREDSSSYDDNNENSNETDPDVEDRLEDLYEDQQSSMDESSTRASVVLFVDQRMLAPD